MRILIADSGATKTDWAYIHNGKPVFMKTSGLHPAYLERTEAMVELKKTLLQTDPDLILFYGAGCYSVDTAESVRGLLRELFPRSQIEINDDLTAVAHAFLGAGKGVAGILGTGSASGYFDRGKKLDQVASLGYVLGDEGSAADLAKRILRAALRGECSQSTLEYLRSKLDSLEYKDVVKQIYSVKRPSYYLAKVTGSVVEGEFPEEISSYIDLGFQSYVDVHLKKYAGFPDFPVVLTGGMAVHQKKRLGKILLHNAIVNFRITGGIITALAERQIERMK